MIGGWLTSPRKELNEEFTSRIALARLGPILVKYLQNLSAISTGSVIVLPSDANRNIGTRHQLNKLNPSVLHVGDHKIDPSVNVRNLGTIFDNSISMDTHINQVCKTAFYHNNDIRRISKYLSQEYLKTLVYVFVTCRLDYIL